MWNPNQRNPKILEKFHLLDFIMELEEERFHKKFDLKIKVNLIAKLQYHILIILNLEAKPKVAAYHNQL